MKTKVCKIIRHGQIVRMSNWNINDIFQVAQISDMGVDEYWKNWVNDSDRVYASCRPMFLTNDTDRYDLENQKYANPVELVNGETVKLEANGKFYRVVDMRPRGWEYVADPIHFELIN